MERTGSAQPQSGEYQAQRNPIQIKQEKLKPAQIILADLVIVVILLILCLYTNIQKKNVIRDAEDVTSQMAEYIAGNIENEIEYARSSIKLASVMIEQTMTDRVLENPAGTILPMIENTPFGGIEYIREDGMNVMNVGEPFDASDRIYYIEGIKGNTGIWNNYHPKTSQEALINFYTPLLYQGEIGGVITGYIEATSQLAPLFETKLYGKEIYGLLLDENDMVICSTIESDFVKDFTLEMFVEQMDITKAQKEQLYTILSGTTDNQIAAFRESREEGRVCVVTIPENGWKVAIIVPAASFNEIVGEHTGNAIITIVIISIILITYASYMLLRNVRKRKLIAAENIKLEEENRVFNEENRRAFKEISLIRDIIASASMGTWRIELVDGKEPEMFADETMKKLLGISNQERTPEETYTDWFSRIAPEAVPSVLQSVERMEQGHFDENTYLWIHPTKGKRYVRCGGTSQTIAGGFSLRGYHYDVDEVVRKEQAQMIELQNTLNDKNEYYSTLGTLGNLFYSLHVINLVDDTVVEFNAKNQVREIVNHTHGASIMMQQIMCATTEENYKESALQFTDLHTLAERMQDKEIISRQFVGKNVGWFLASFISMERDETGKTTKVIYTTRVIDEEKKQEEKLIYKTQTDELTGLLNRRAYEENIYEHNDTPEEDNFIYISLDVNGLKVVNDTQGHMAGDELIIGACQCMKDCLGPYGRLYRIGGDEFVAILFCNPEQITGILKKFDETIENWSGKLVGSLSISYGWIDKNENPDASVRQLGSIAEQRMYEAKAAHYRKIGVDRRGQAAAHTALCNLYTKILKINITSDSFMIVNIDDEEKKETMGYSDKISEWLRNFGVSGQVHEEDLEDYLKKTDIHFLQEYFKADKTSISIFYRRKYQDTFKQVVMEMIPANDYQEDDQSLFLYVKEIDK